MCGIITTNLWEELTVSFFLRKEGRCWKPGSELCFAFRARGRAGGGIGVERSVIKYLAGSVRAGKLVFFGGFASLSSLLTGFFVVIDDSTDH